MSDWIGRIRRASPRRRAGLALALGMLAPLALPPLSAVPVLALTIPALLLLLEAAESRRQAFAIAWCYGFGYHLIGLYWISFALFTDIAGFWWALPFSAAGLPVLLGVFAGLAGVGYRLLRPSGLWRPLAFATVWTAAELLRGHAFTGFPWNLPGYVWVDVPAVLQTAALAGVNGLGFITVLLAALPALLLFDDTPRRAAAGGLAIGALLLAGLTVWGAQRLAGAPTDAPDAMVPGVRLRLIQPNIPQTLKWEPGRQRANFHNQLQLTAAAAELPPTHVIWAETAVPFYLEREPQARSAIAAALPPGAMAIIGTPRPGPPRGPDDPPRFFNGLLALNDSGAVIAAYDKFHLVPFGEYMPLRGVLPLPAIAGNGGEYLPGPGPQTLRLPGAPPVSPLICYEAIFPGAVSDPADRPGWLLNLTNDAWYGPTAGPHQHLAIAAVRAVEEGAPLVRVANTGISAVIDAYGRRIAELPLGVRGALDSGLPVAIADMPPYARWKDMPLFVVLFSAALLCVLQRRMRN